jgi:hypothetical protein
MQKRSHWSSLQYKFIHLLNHPCGHLYLVLFQNQLSKRHSKIRTVMWKSTSPRKWGAVMHKGGTWGVPALDLVHTLLASRWVIDLVLVVLPGTIRKAASLVPWEAKDKLVTAGEMCTFSCPRPFRDVSSRVLLKINLCNTYINCQRKR